MWVARYSSSLDFSLKNHWLEPNGPYGRFATTVSCNKVFHALQLVTFFSASFKSFHPLWKTSNWHAISKAFEEYWRKFKALKFTGPWSEMLKSNGVFPRSMPGGI